jgi:hypothetical protein
MVPFRKAFLQLISSLRAGFDVRDADFLSESNYLDFDPVIHCLDEQCRFAHKMLDVATAPSLLLCNLKIATEISSTNGSQKSMLVTRPTSFFAREGI